jgi:SAM-dependent methyltransferase
MDAEELKFNEESFDAVLSGFSLFFLPDLEKCLGEIKRVLKKDGVFVTSTWGDRDARWKPLLDLMASFQQKVNPVTSIKTRALNSETELKEQFLKAGFNKIEISLETKEFYYNNEEEWMQSLWSHGRRGMMEKMSDSDLEYFKKEAFNFLSTIKNESRIPELFSVYITKVFKD